MLRGPDLALMLSTLIMGGFLIGWITSECTTEILEEDDTLDYKGLERYLAAFQDLLITQINELAKLLYLPVIVVRPREERGASFGHCPLKKTNLTLQATGRTLWLHIAESCVRKFAAEGAYKGPEIPVKPPLRYSIAFCYLILRLSGSNMILPEFIQLVYEVGFCCL